jgi:hypothetical protein
VSRKRDDREDRDDDDDERDKKERVIHTRVPAHLDETIKKRANGLGLSVSNLVRNVLSNTFGLVDTVIADGTNIARAARGEDVKPTPPIAIAPVSTAAEPMVLGWQEAKLALNAVCARCNAILPKGTQAAIAITDRPGARPFLCVPCMKEELGHGPEAK